MSDKVKLSRRSFLKASAAAILGAALQACAQPTPAPQPTRPPAAVPTATPKPAEPTATPKPAEPTKPAPTATPKPPEPTATPKPVTKFKEAPMLAALVKAGKLPPVEERLPLNPCVCPVMEMTGKYGGTMRRGFTGVSDRWGPDKVTHNQLIWYNADLSLRPNICESWDLNKDATEWTVRLRKGMKWSDGQPFTGDDFKWWYDYILMHKTLTPAVGASWYTGKKTVMQLNVPDKYTVVFKFADPNPLFVYTLTGSDPYAPSHYLKQFHMDLVQDKAALEKAYKDAKFSSWETYFNDNRNAWYMNPDLPTTHAWNATNQISQELFIMERNPYFFQVDKDGNQLPYIDKIVHRLYNTVDVFNMWIVGGEIDYQHRGVQLANYTLFKENEKKGGYRVFTGAEDATHAVVLNHTCLEKRKREFIQNRDVRIALSHAINRTEINELAYDGRLKPRQYSPPSQSPQYYPKLSNAYIEYDPKKANELLDKAGYKERDKDGFRKWKDGSGETISLIIQTFQAGIGDEGEMIVKQWANVGIKAAYKPVERSFGEQQGRINAVDIEHHYCSRAILPLVDPAFFIATAQDKSWCKAWTLWYNDPKAQNAEEPPADHFIHKLWDIWTKIRMEPNAQKQHEMMLQIFDILAVEIPMPGTVGEIPCPIIVKNGLRNLDPKYIMPISNPTKHGLFIPLQTYFWEEPEKHT